MAEMMESPGFWAVIPAQVRYDPKLPPNAKLLYAEISALTNAHGFCWASNAWFAERFDMQPKSVSVLIGKLAKAGYVAVETDTNQNNENRRKIYLQMLPPPGYPLKNGDGYPLKNGDGYPLKNGGGLPKKTEQNNKYNIIIPPISPTGKTAEEYYAEALRPKYMPMDVFHAIGDYCGEDAELMMAWMGWAEMRYRTKKPVATVSTVRRACNKLDELSEGFRDYKLGLLHKATDRGWRGLFALEPGDEGYSSRNYSAGGRLPTWD